MFARGPVCQGSYSPPLGLVRLRALRGASRDPRDQKGSWRSASPSLFHSVSTVKVLLVRGAGLGSWRGPPPARAASSCSREPGLAPLRRLLPPLPQPYCCAAGTAVDAVAAAAWLPPPPLTLLTLVDREPQGLGTSIRRPRFALPDAALAGTVSVQAIRQYCLILPYGLRAIRGPSAGRLRAFPPGFCSPAQARGR